MYPPLENSTTRIAIIFTYLEMEVLHHFQTQLDFGLAILRPDYIFWIEIDMPHAEHDIHHLVLIVFFSFRFYLKLLETEKWYIIYCEKKIVRMIEKKLLKYEDLQNFWDHLNSEQWKVRTISGNRLLFLTCSCRFLRN